MAKKQEESKKEYDNNMTGMLMKNHEADDENGWPQYNGMCEINGVGYWISGWIKEASGKGKMEKGEKFFSLAFKKRDGFKKEDEADIPF